jgi:hypothetical protein
MNAAQVSSPKGDQIQWLKEWDGRPARLFCFISYGRDARATLCVIWPFARRAAFRLPGSIGPGH